MLPHIIIFTVPSHYGSGKNLHLRGGAGSKFCGLDNGCLADGHGLWSWYCITSCISQDSWSLACLSSRLLFGHLVITRIKVLLPICKSFLEKNRVATHRPSCHRKFGFQFSFFQFFYICCRNIFWCIFLIVLTFGCQSFITRCCIFLLFRHCFQIS